MHPTDIFPLEIWVKILTLLEATDIRNYQRACKSFYHWVETVPSIQLRLELDAVGYIEARNCNHRASDEERLKILREHILRRRALSPSQVDTLWQVEGDFDDPRAAAILSVQGQLPVFSEGVLARRLLGTVTKNQLEIVQLPSPNSGTGLRCWTLDEREIGFRDEFWIQPSFNLLVLLKLDLHVQNTVDAWYNPQAHYEFHLRTLSGNDNHPDAFEPVLRLSNQPLDDRFEVKFVGRLMLFQLHVGEASKLVVWDWMTGSVLLDKILEHSRVGLTIVSDDLLAIARTDTTLGDGSSSPCIGSFDVFRLDHDSRPELGLILVGCFELPGTNNTLFSCPGTRSVFRARRVGLSFAPESSYIASAGLPVTSPSKVFEASNNERILQLNVLLYLEEDHWSDCESGPGDPELGSTNFSRNSPLPLCSVLCIPIKTILGKISKVSTGVAGDYTIPWSEWGPKTRWIHDGSLRGDPVTSGSRCAFPRFNERRTPRSRCVASILEFHPKLQFVQAPRGSRGENELAPEQEDRDDGVSILGFAPLQPGIDTWFDDASRLAVLPYTMAELNHKAIAGERPIKGRPVILLSEEHMIIIQRTLYGHTKCVAVLTF